MEKRRKIAIILRGLPGSGKSTIAELLAKSTKSSALHSTDSYFYRHIPTVDSKGKRTQTKEKYYDFNHHLLIEYHTKNLKAFEASCKRGKQVVICDNTNILRKHYRPYIEVAKKYGYNISIIMIEEFRPLICYKRQNHGVPYDIIKRMKDNFEK